MTLPEITLRLQLACKERGNDPGVLDGIYGYNTATALAETLGVDLDESTIPVIEEMDKPAWLVLAEAEIGVSEYVVGDNPRIVEYHSATELAATRDEVPWCSSFMCWVMEQSGIKSTRSAAARSWLKWGKPIDIPRQGCIVVFARGNNPAAGHVGLYAGPGKTSMHCMLVSGNIGNKVIKTDYSLRRLLGYRWPLSYPKNPTEVIVDQPSFDVLASIPPEMIYDYTLFQASTEQVIAALRGAVHRLRNKLENVDDPLIEQIVTFWVSEIIGGSKWKK